MKPKTFRRLVLLGALVTLIAGGFFGAVVVRKHRMNARLTESRETGFAAAQAKNHQVTLDKLGPYLRRRPEDAEALLAYARARAAIEERAARHLVEAAAIYQRYLALKPADETARGELFDALISAGLDVEIVDLATRMRPADLAQLTPSHAKVIREEIAARLRRKDITRATIDLAKRLTEIAPTDYSSRALYVAALTAAERRQDALEFVQAIAKAEPNDPRVALLQVAVGDERINQTDWLVDRLCAIAGLDPVTGKRVGPPVDTSSNVIGAVVSGFDTLGRSELSLATLDAVVTITGDRDAIRVWIRRAWYAGNDDAVLAPPPANSPAEAWSDPDVLAFRAMSLKNKGDTGAARAEFAKITAADFRSRAWVTAAPGLGLGSAPTPAATPAATPAPASTPAPAPADDAFALRTAIELNPIEPVFRVSLAEAMLRRAQPEQARQELTAAIESPLSIGWATPYVFLANTYLSEGRPGEGERAALQGLKRHPRDVRLNLLGLASKIDQIERGLAGRDAAESMLTRLDAIAAQWASQPASTPGDEALQWFILGRAVCADAIGNRERVAAALKDANANADKLKPSVLTRLAIISARNNLDADASFRGAIESGAATPETVLARAILLNDQGKADDARKLVDDALADPTHSSRLWHEVRPRVLDTIGDPAAAQAWKKYADAHESDLDAQLAALESPSVAKDPALVEQLVQRFTKFAGASGKLPLRVRLAQARSLMIQQPPTAANIQRVVGMLRPITTTEAPELAEPRLLLADALLIDIPGSTVDRGGAIEQLRAAIPLTARPWEPRLRVAELMSLTGDTQAAAREYSAIGINPRADLPYRWDAAAKLALLGQFDSAGAIVTPLVDIPGSITPARAVLAARIQTTTGNRDRAAQVLNRLQDAKLTADEASDVAIAWAALGAMDKGKAVIERAAAGAADRAPFDRALVRLQAQGSPAQAIGAAVQLRDASPQQPENHRAVVALYLADGRAEEARQAVDDALKLHPDDPDLRLQRVQIALYKGASDTASLESLAKALDAKPEFKRRAEAVRALLALEQSDKAGDPAALKGLVTQFSDEPTVASYVASTLLKQRRAADAADVAGAALRRFPTFTQLGRDAYRAAAAAGRWQDALTAAEQWQRLTRGRDADVAVAQANLALGRPRLARTALEPHIDAAAKDPDRSAAVIGLWAEVLVTPASAEDARKFLEPIATKSPAVLRAVWIPLATSRVPAGEAARWLERAEALAPAEPDDKLVISRAWFALADRDPANRTAHLARARTIATSVAQAGANPQASYILGMIGGAQGDYDRAESDFKAATADDATKIPASVGLARIALARGRPLDAVSIAQSAVAASTPPDLDARIALAECLQAAAAAETDPAQRKARWIEASTAFEAAAAASPNAAQLVAQAAICQEQAQQPDDAIRLYELALASPSLEPQTRAFAQNNLAYLLVTARSDPTSVTRGLELARAAADAQSNGATFDTLGSCELAAGNASAAVDAFRRSLKLREGWPSTMVKLADALIAASPADTTEAQSLLDQAQSLLAAKPNPVVSERLTQVRAKLKPAGR